MSRMEIDNDKGPSAPKVRIIPMMQHGPHGHEIIPVTIESDKDESPRDCLLKILDQVDTLVEKLRRDTMQLEEERDSLLSTLDTLRNSEMLQHVPHVDREEVERYAELLTSRIQTIDINVRTERDGHQEDALHQVNKLIDRLVVDIASDPEGTKIRCLSYINACATHGSSGATDQRFENSLLGCTADDQKRIRRRLQGLLTYFDAAVVETS